MRHTEKRKEELVVDHNNAVLLDVFAYGTLMPGEANHDSVMAPLTIGPTTRASIPGARIYDTGWSFPALLPDDDPDAVVHGWVSRLADSAALAVLDSFESEGSMYVRRRVFTIGARRPVWVYVWAASRRSLTVHPDGWERATWTRFDTETSTP